MKLLWLLLSLALLGTSLSQDVDRDDIPEMSEHLPEEDLVDELRNPCQDKLCDAGQTCLLDDKQEPYCQCLEQCPEFEDDRRKVCTNYNETWESDCEVHRMRCLCAKNDSRCSDDKLMHVHIDYLGSCRDIEDCKPEHLKDFPKRMKKWLFNVMDDMSQSDQLAEGYKELLDEAVKNDEYKWINAVLWKFCDLDTHPSDRSVSRHELFPIRAPLLAMEHCMAPFLDSCDPNEDHIITLEEWGNCLGIEPEKITDRCIH